jgi:hypothetical protein
MKIRPVGAELFHEDDIQTFTKLTVAIRNLANASKNIYTFKRKSTPVTRNLSYDFTKNTTDIMSSFLTTFCSASFNPLAY